MTKRILAYGDSNTWGFLPVDGANPKLERLPFKDRWTGVAQAQLGADYEIVEDALPGRTLGVDRPDMAGARSLDPATWNGLKELPVALIRNVPLDLVILSLGTNDLLMDPDLSVDHYVERVISLVAKIGSFQLPLPLKGMGQPAQVLVMAPPGFGPVPEAANIALAEAKRANVLPALLQNAHSRCYHLVNAAEAVPTLGGDGVHLDHDAQLKLGGLMAKAIKTVFSDLGPAK